jgi:hypothetical protein
MSALSFRITEFIGLIADGNPSRTIRSTEYIQKWTVHQPLDAGIGVLGLPAMLAHRTGEYLADAVVEDLGAADGAEQGDLATLAGVVAGAKSLFLLPLRVFFGQMKPIVT